MRKVFIAIILITLLSGVLAFAEDILQVDKSKYTKLPGFIGYKSNEFIVVLKDNVAVDHASDKAYQVALNHIPEFAGLARKYKVDRLRPQFVGADKGPRAATAKRRNLARHYKVRIAEGDLDAAVEAYSKLPMVEKVEKIGIHTVYATPNDTYYDDPPVEYPHDQWHYWDTYGIRANTAWDKETGSTAVLVGDLDIGTKYDHGDLGGSNPPGPNDASTNGNIWVNTNEIPGNGVDDDGNGYVDDIIGWDFVERTDWYSYSCIDNDCGGADNDPSDGDGHGTHTAGTIAAISNNGYCVAGVAGGFGNGTYSGGGNGVKVVPCRIGYVLDYWIYGATGVVIMDYVAEAMYYMAELKIAGWNVAAINCSFGSSNSGGLGAAADYLIAQDVVICVAAGNSSSSSADYLGSRGDCLDVAATDQSGNNASFTNYGSWVDIAAPGVEIMSTITDPSDPSGDYIAYMDGTSMACPHVAGVVGLLESYNPALSATDKINIITDPANTNPYGGSRDLGAGIIDARKCLDAAGGGCDLAADFSGSPTTGCAGMTVNFSDLSTGTNINGWSWTFGDGGTSTAQNPNHTYNTPGNYTVSLTVSSSSQGCDDTATRTNYITVNGGPTASFTGSPTSGTEPLTVNFTNTSTDAASYSWNFGDGGTSTAQDPSHIYNTAGTYTVTLTATNACGSDQEVKTNYITVNPCILPVAAFSGSPTSGELPLTVNFANSSTDATSYSWNFGDGGTSTAQNPSHTYNAAGTYTVTLTATNACGSDDEVKTDYITVTCTPPTANFSGTPTAGEEPLTVDFTDMSTGATSWSWNFGDGGTSTSQDPSHTYTAAGTYTVTLTATNSCGSDNEVKTDYITVSPCTLPVAGFVGSPTVGDAPLTVDFTDQSTNATSWSWNFGDGGTSTAQNPSHTYTAEGTYTVTLTVTNACGSDNEVKTDYITVNPGSGFCDDFNDGNISDWTVISGDWTTSGGQLDGFISSGRAFILAPAGDVADGSITVDWTSLTGGQYTNGIVVFGWQDASNYRVADCRDGANKYYIREFIGGTQYNRAQFAETINTNQQYALEVVIDPSGLVTLKADGATKVSYNFGNVITGPVGLAVNQSHSQFDNFCVNAEAPPPPAPVAAFAGTPTGGEVPLTVNFTDQSTGDITSWSWTFGDGGTSTAQNPSHQYTATGDYTVSLTVTGPGGSDDEVKTDYISVTCTMPVAAFSGAPTGGDYPLTVDFTDASTDATSWSWDFGDGGTSTQQNPSYTYNAVGTYTVELTATNSCGSDVETKVDYINVTDPGSGGWTTITYDDFESGWGSYTDGGGDCALYTYGTYAHQGSAAADVQDNSGTASSFYHTGSYNVTGYSELEIEFWFMAISMDNTKEDFWVQYYDGSAWQTVATYARTTDFDNGVFYNKVVTISSSQYNFPTNAKIRFMCDASGNRDDVYIDEIEFRGYGSVAKLAEYEPFIPDAFSLHQNFPNPFNPVTEIGFSLPTAAHVNLTVYNILGQQVSTLADRYFEAGNHIVVWDASSSPSGIYLYRIDAGQFNASRKMILLK